MTETGEIVLVTTELFPFMSGGIGRLSYNTLLKMTPEERARTTMILTEHIVDEDRFAALFPEVTFYQLETYDFSNIEDGLRWAVEAERNWLTIATKTLAVLKDIALRTPIAFVEFPDWSGYGFATIQEKRLTGFLADATIAVRLHSTETVLVFAESRLLQQIDLQRYDVERLALRDCDMVIGHLQPVVDLTRKIFGLDQESWDARLFIADPPLTLNDGAFAEKSIIPQQAKHIAFSSKFQECKRPEVFVRGAADFVARSDDFDGTVEFACTLLENAYTGAVLDAIPKSLRRRFVSHDRLSMQKRDDILAQSIVVFATGFESYCLAAYEAAALGSVVVLNGTNPAFGDGTPWIDGVNCIKFDGTTHGLSTALSRCMGIAKPMDVLCPPDAAQPWQLPARPAKAPLPAKQRGLAALVVNQNEGAILQATLDSIFAAEAMYDQIVIVDDGSQDPESEVILAALEARALPHVQIMRLPVTHGYASALTLGLRAVTAPNCLVMRSGYLVTADYVADAARGLDYDADIAAVVAQVRSYVGQDHLDSGHGQLSIMLGDAAISGGGVNAYGEFGFVVRTQIARTIGLRAETGYLCDWAFMQSLVQAGHQTAVSLKVGIARRTRIERDNGTPIDEHIRLTHIVATDRNTSFLHAPVMRLPVSLIRTQVNHQRIEVPNWYFHMLENGYESEVAFMADFFGNSRFGRFIRNNARFSNFMEGLVGLVSRIGPK
jgi:hypothetical protein